MSTTDSSANPTQQVTQILAARSDMTDLQQTVLEKTQESLQKRAAAFAQIAKGQTGGTSRVEQRVALYQSLAASVRNARLDVAQLPQASADTFTLHGQVLDASGDPAANARVSLTDSAGILAKRVPVVTTDANGYYTITLRSAEFPDLESGKSQLFVAVTDSKKREIATPTQPITYQPGKVALFPISA